MDQKIFVKNLWFEVNDSNANTEKMSKQLFLILPI